MIRKFAYFSSLLHPISVGAGLLMGGNWIYSTVILSMMIYPAVEVLTKPRVNLGDVHNLSLLPEFVARSTAIVVIIMVIATIMIVPNNKSTILESIVLVYSCGLTSGIVGVVLAHEFFHRRVAIDRYLGSVLMYLVSYPHFKLQHLYSHHPNVATESDYSSAKRGQTIYSFYVQSIFSGGLSVWRKECCRSQIHSRFKYHPVYNRFIALWLWQGLIYLIVFCLFGPVALAVFVSQGLVAVFVLETINYIQHYGLNRPLHSQRPSGGDSWDNYSLTNYCLFNLGYHSDHHVNPSKSFQSLSRQSAAPVMPYGYFTMAAIALIPPLWYYMMKERN